MPPLSFSAFAHCFRRLEATDRARFVAACWSGRGWETTVEGDTIVATRGVEERRIRIVSPRVFGTPAVGDVDVLVVTEDDEALRTVAETNGHRYVTPADLRDLLCYGLSRDHGDQLMQEFFDRPLESTAEPDQSSKKDISLSTWFSADRLRTSAPSSDGLVVLVVLLTIGGIAASGPGFNSSAEDPGTTTVTDGSYTPGTVRALGATTTPTQAAMNDSEMPPGLSSERVTNVTALADAHAAALVGERYTLELVRAGPDRTIWHRSGTRWTETMHVESERRYRYQYAVAYEDSDRERTEWFELSVFSDGETVHLQRITDAQTEYEESSAQDSNSVDWRRERLRETVLVYLDAPRSSVECVETLDSGECVSYRIVATGTPNQLSEDVEEYRATAAVDEDGFVTSLQVEYTVPDEDADGRRESVRFGFEFTNRGDVTVSPPLWVEDERSNSTVIATPTNRTEST